MDPREVWFKESKFVVEFIGPLVRVTEEIERPLGLVKTKEGKQAFPKTVVWDKRVTYHTFKRWAGAAALLKKQHQQQVVAWSKAEAKSKKEKRKF